MWIFLQRSFYWISHLFRIRLNLKFNVLLVKHFKYFDQAFSLFARVWFVSRERIIIIIITMRKRKRKGDDDSSKPLWKFVSEIPDVFAAEVLTKLNEFEVKIFYDLCRASRAVVIRSKIKLNNERRYVYEIESMQELEIAWKYYPWGERDRFGRELTKEYFCYQVAQTNNLDFLKWAREVKQCAWNRWTITQAAFHGNLEMVKYCVENDCPRHASTCSNAAMGGHLDVLKYLHEHDCPWDSNTCLYAYENNHIECLNYAIEHECPGWEEYDS